LNRKDYNIAVKENANRLYAFFLKNCKCDELANDLVQDSFEKLWINRKSVEPEKAKQWLFTTGYRIMLNTLKREKKVENREEFSENTLRSEKSTEFENKDLIEKILICLNERQRSIIMLRDFEGYDYKEIGNILRLNESQVKVYLFRARKKIKEHLKKHKYLVA
jgi:RNA polymerase sigma factor (sigma-70 family)